MGAIRDHFVVDPPSRDIAEQLEARARIVCEHDRDPCLLRCGVRRHHLTERWTVIPLEERLAWLERVEALAARDAASEKSRPPNVVSGTDWSTEDLIALVEAKARVLEALRMSVPKVRARAALEVAASLGHHCEEIRRLSENR